MLQRLSEMLINLILFLVPVLLLSYLWVRHLCKYKSLDNTPTVQPCYPILGNAPISFWKSEEQMFQIILQECMKFDRFFKVWAGPRLILATCHPDLIHQIINHPDCIQRPFLYKFTGFTQGIFSADWKLWKVQRKAMNPAFNTIVLNSFIPTFEGCSRRMVQRMTEGITDAGGANLVNILKYASLCTLEMICATSLGSDVMQRETKADFVHSIEVAFNCASRRMIKPLRYLDVIYRLTQDYRDQRKAWNVICDFFMQIIKEKKQEMQTRLTKLEATTSPIDCTNKDIVESKKSKIFIERLLNETRAGIPFSDTEIFDNTYHIITLGNDTSALEVTHASLFLAIYPEIQQKIYVEIMHFAPSEETKISPECLKQMEYLDKFLKECLRHCPTAANIARTNVIDVELDGMKVPAGTTLSMCLYALHRRKDFWGPDAERFDPENFSPERVKQRHPHAFLPFSEGARNCLGYRYAMISMKIMLIHILRKYRLKTTLRHQDLRYKFDMTLKLAIDPLVELDPRQ